MADPFNSKFYTKLCIVFKNQGTSYLFRENKIISFQEAFIHKLQENFDTAIIEIETVCKNENTGDIKVILTYVKLIK